MAHYSAKHYRLLANSDSQEKAADRVKLDGVLAIVRLERITKYPSITAANFDEVSNWQQNRISELMAS